MEGQEDGLVIHTYMKVLRRISHEYRYPFCNKLTNRRL